MSGKKRKLKSKQEMARDDLAEFFTQLAEKLKSDQLVFKMGDRDIAMEVPQSFQLKIEVVEKIKKKGSAHRLSIDMRWADTIAEAKPEISLG